VDRQVELGRLIKQAKPAKILAEPVLIRRLQRPVRRADKQVGADKQERADKLKGRTARVSELDKRQQLRRTHTPPTARSTVSS
jgi:hypothetical protein